VCVYGRQDLRVLPHQTSLSVSSGIERGVVSINSLLVNKHGIIAIETRARGLLNHTPRSTGD
jgi:hypothetical protein